jgi:hypothetical protein
MKSRIAGFHARRSDSRDRLDQVIAHEHAEATGIDHEEAVQRAAETPLAIRETARDRLRAIAEVEKRGKRR